MGKYYHLVLVATANSVTEGLTMNLSPKLSKGKKKFTIGYMLLNEISSSAGLFFENFAEVRKITMQLVYCVLLNISSIVETFK